MRIGIDSRMYSESGVGRYIRNLIDKLQTIDKENEYFIFLLKKDFEKVNFTSDNFQKIPVDFKWYGLREQIKFPSILKKYNLDLVHFPHFNIPVFYMGKFVVTIHDLIHQNFSMQRSTTHGPILHKIKKYGYNRVFKSALDNSSKIIVPSNFVQNQLIEKWHVRKEKVEVTYEAVDDKILKIKDKISKTDIQKTLDKFDIKAPFIFYVGNAHPHKNVEGLIKAFRRIKSQESRVKGLKLVLAGHDHYFWERIRTEFFYSHPEFISGSDGEMLKPALPAGRQVQHDIVFTGFVSDEEMVALYKSAQCFVMPSFEEGFGIPILEAMACGCPVVSSNGGSLPEVGGDACLYFDPRNTEDMAEKISNLLSSVDLKQQLISKGEKRYKLFSWKKLAELTIKIYKS